MWEWRDSLNMKSMFTARRAIIAFLPFSSLFFALQFSIFMIKRINKKLIQYLIRSVDDVGLANRTNDIFNRNILSWGSFLTELICLITTVINVQASANFNSSVLVKSPTTAVDYENLRLRGIQTDQSFYL